MPQARHPKAASFVRQNLFAGVANFSELETRIAALPDEQSRGCAFEVFAEAYLATHRKHDAAKVWPLTAVPTHILQTLGLAVQDYGVDGVFQTLLGQFNAYQVKFRTGRPALTWRELSTFMGLADSPRIRSRVLLTNCDELPSVLNERQGFFCIRGADLDRLEPDDFRAIEAWLADAGFTAPKKQPQPHQIEALDALLPALETHDRVSAIMACGTGKTLVALWVTEHVARAATPASSGGIPAARILVLVPSLALLRQILHEWLRETSLSSLAYLCVCSDPTVKEGLDAIATEQSDLDFQVSTDAASLRDFLDAPFTDTKIVFSTYQSAQVVGAALKPGEAFDLAVFDEAHKTAGREGRNYAFALEDTNLPIRKRLFLTATPRHYNPHQRDREGDAQLVFSMDRPEVYGPQVYRLTFAEAARRGIICGYKVIISVITSEMVTNELLSRGEVLVNGEAVRARQVANQIALRDAIEKYGVKKVFTFHSTVKSAQSFVSDGAEGVGTHLASVAADVRRLNSKPETQEPNESQSLVTSAPTSWFQTFHVNGTMPTARREREMRDFRSAARAVMSNARCLTEGVDVPAVDMVAFLSPRRSRVDIVQATGRAMRRSPGKATGFVLVPLYVELTAGETVAAAVNRAEFDEVWDVLQSLQEQDDVLAEIIRAMREERGRTKGFDDARFFEIVDVLGRRISLKALRRAITTACIDFLGDAWEERFGELKVFKERFGHCDVPVQFSENRQLGVWVFTQRRTRKIGKLSSERVRRLNEIGFTWDAVEASWERMFAALLAYKQKHGDCLVPAKWGMNPALGGWVSHLRQLKSIGKLSEDRMRRLDQIGFVWNSIDTRWEKMFAALSEYKRQHGHCEVPDDHSANPQLGFWVSTQRQARKNGKISKGRLQRLDEIGFVWEPYDAFWEEMYGALVAYKRQHGDCNVPLFWKLNPTLGRWMANQRERQGQLAPGRIRRLEKLGIVWEPLRTHEKNMFAALQEFRTEHGHCDVPAKWPRNPMLGLWLFKKRKLAKEGKLNAKLVKRLESLGVTLNPNEAQWEKMFVALREFKREHGHCNVPHLWPQDRSLGMWLAGQRQRKRKDKLDSSRAAKLEGLGVVWDQDEADWEEKFAALTKFKKKFGHCDIPARWKGNPSLGGWLSALRAKKKNGKLDAVWVKRLGRLGIEWNPCEAAWEQMFSVLLTYKRKHGDCSVPDKSPEHSSLGAWVRGQRRDKRSSKLRRDRIQRLDEIGFIWNPHDAGWERRFAELLDFKREYGHCNVPICWRENAQLGSWVSTQRQFRRTGKLSRERMRRLSKAGFEWKLGSR